MSLVKWALAGLLVLPAAEIAALFLLAAAIGWWLTIVLFVATSALGVLLLRRLGRSELDRLWQALTLQGLRAVNLETPGLAPVLGAILLVIPGFVTDLAGAALFLPAARRWASAGLRKAARRRRDNGRDKSAPQVIDLDPGEWHQMSDRSRNGARKSKRAGKSRTSR